MPKAKLKPGRRPDYDVFVVEGDDEEDRDGDKRFWTKIGGAWIHQDQAGLSIALAALPHNGRLVLRKPKPPEGQEAAGGEPE